MREFFKNHRWAAPLLGFLIVIAVGSILTKCAEAATFHVRPDGGSALQCTGAVDAPYPGTGTGQPCAWRHPFTALPPSGAARFSGGDTLSIGPGAYAIGLGAPDASGCYAAGSYDCIPARPPSGTAQAPTRIVGKGFDTECQAPPVLWGTERATAVLNLAGTSNVTVACLEITDRSDCIEFHCPNGGCAEARTCQRDRPPFGQWASNGIAAKGASNLTLRDIDVHGLAGRGFIGGGLRDVTMERVKLVANGWGGWEGDTGAGSSNAGAIVLRNVEIAWNGCAERYPTRDVFGCWAQEAGGYGDGIGTALTGGAWLIEDSSIHHNTSDGIDLLYADGSGSVTVRRTRVEANAGNQIKTNGPATIENNIVIGSCAFFAGKYNMRVMDNCRALGNTLSIGLKPGAAVALRNNAVIGEGDCLVLSSGGDATSTINADGNLFVGAPDWHGVRTGNAGELSCGHYADNSAAKVTWTANRFSSIKPGTCPPGSVCGEPPAIVNATLAAFDPTPIGTTPKPAPLPTATVQFEVPVQAGKRLICRWED
jgi:hypothetical protein